MCRYELTPAVPGRRGGGRSFARKAADAVSRATLDVLESDEIASRPGLLQRIDPRIKLLTLLLFAVTVSLVHAVWLLLVLVGVTLVLAAISRVGLGAFARRVWSTAGLLAILVALPAATALITPGRVIVPLGPLSLTEPGLWAAATLVSRVVAAAGFALLVIWTMRWTDLLRALTAMRVPNLVVATLAIAQKQIVSLLKTVEQMHLARESRTILVRSTSQDRSWVSGRAAFVVRRSLKRADDVYDAMLARGFDGSMRAIARLRIDTGDIAWAALCVAVCTAFISVDKLAGA